MSQPTDPLQEMMADIEPETIVLDIQVRYHDRMKRADDAPGDGEGAKAIRQYADARVEAELEALCGEMEPIFKGWGVRHEKIVARLEALRKQQEGRE